MNRWAEYGRLLDLQVTPWIAFELAKQLDEVTSYGGRRIRHAREHGTPRGYQQHRYLGLAACDRCLSAHAEQTSDREAAA